MASNTDHAINLISQLDIGSFKSDLERIAVIKTLKSVLARCMTPVEHIFDLTWIQPAYIAALKTTIDTDLYTKWVAQGGSHMTASELSVLSGIDEKILVRLLRHLVAMNGLEQCGIGIYALTPFGRSLAGPGNQDAFHSIVEETYPAFMNLTGFLSKLGHSGPIDPVAGNWQDLKGTSESYIEYLLQDSDRTQHFHRVMKAYNDNTPAWVDIYPSDRLVQDLKPDRAVVVDIGGSTGADLLAFQRKYPSLPSGSLINQDLERVINDIPLPEGITPMVQDVFHPQVVKGKFSNSDLNW